MKIFSSTCFKMVLVLLALLSLTPVLGHSDTIKVMTANLNSGVPPSSDWYRDASKNIFKGLEPDIVLIQEFNVDSGTTRSEFIADVFDWGDPYYYYYEPEIGGTWAMPNGVISRWPILSSGQWNDSQLTNRSFVWAVIDIPGDIDLQVVSIHLKSGSGIDDRQTREAEASQIKNYVIANFDDNKYIIVGGDLNLQYDGEPPFSTFLSYLDADNHRPRDRTDDTNTNSTTPRSKPYDWIMPNALLDNQHTTIHIGSESQAFPDGIVFDSEIFTSLATVPPIEFDDSRQSGCTHMAVMKAFTSDVVATPTPGPASPTPTARLSTPTPDPAQPTPTAGLSTPTPDPGYPTPTAGPPIPTPFRIMESGDYNGDGTSDIAIFRPRTGLWAIRDISRLYFGPSSALTVPGDYNGNGTTDVAVFIPQSGLWAARDLSLVYYGSLTDIPIPGDYDGDGTVDVGIFRRESGLWAVRSQTRVYYGSSTDSPVPGDWNGDGTANVGIFRQSSGLWAIRDISRVYYGTYGDRVIPGDYNGDGACDFGIYRGSAGLWVIRGISRVYYGNLIDQPVPADYTGDGMADYGLFRETSGLWAVKNITRTYYGGVGDIPVTR